MVGRYAVISTDPADKIIRGVIKWDPADMYDPGEGLQLMPEQDAYDAGYSFPPPDPEPTPDPDQD